MGDDQNGLSKLRTGTSAMAAPSGAYGEPWVRIARRSHYAAQIEKLAPGYDPRHIEAFMRVQHGALDKLSPDRFRAEVEIGKLCVDEGGVEGAERLAKSYGF